MPIFMDRHDTPPDFTAEDMAAAHRKDVENQDRFGANIPDLLVRPSVSHSLLPHRGARRRHGGAVPS